MKTKCVLLFVFVALLLLGAEARKSRGRSRGSSGGGRSKTKYPTQHVDPVALSYGPPKKKAPDSVRHQQKPSAPPAESVKPGAPVSETVNKQSVGAQNSASPGNQRPIGWNVDGNKDGGVVGNKDVGWNVGGQQSHGALPNAAAGQAAIASHTPHQQAPHQQASYPNQNQQPGYPNAAPGAQHIPHQQASYPNQNQQSGLGQQYPQQPGFGQQQPGYGVGQPGYGSAQHPHYPQQYPHYQQPGYGQAGYPGYPQQPGGFGHGFGGNTWSPFGGGSGGYFGGYGMNNYPHKSSGGFFGKHTFRNILAGLLVWNLVRGFTSTPYHVYHYYHRPDNIPENIPLPANTIVLCDDNSTSICTPNTIPLCTKNNTIFCVATISATSPCGDNTTTPCVNSTIPCATPDDPLCANKTTENNATTISIPCLANVTLLGKIDLPQNSTTYNASIQLNGGERVFCLTTMALPDPALANATVAPPLICDGNSTENCSPPPSAAMQMCEGNSTEGCVPKVIPLSSTTTTTTVQPTVVNATKESVDNATKESVTSESSTPAAT